MPQDNPANCGKADPEPSYQVFKGKENEELWLKQLESSLYLPISICNVVKLIYFTLQTSRMLPRKTTFRESIEEGPWKEDREVFLKKVGDQGPRAKQSPRWQVHLHRFSIYVFFLLLKKSSSLQNQSSLEHLSLENLPSLEHL